MRGRSFSDCLMLALAASLTLWADLPAVEVVVVMVVLMGATLAELGAE
jgi:hypothetical protein